MKIKLQNILDALQRIPVTEKIFFADRLRVMIKAGLSLGQALETLAEETKNKRFKKILTDIHDAVSRGEQFSSALDKYPTIFSNFFRSMIRVGETAGTLENNLLELSAQMHKDHALLQKIRGAMTYPIIVLVATIGIIIGIFTYVMPNIISVFETFEATLPLSTRIVIAISKTMNQYGLFVLVGITIFCACLVWFFRRAGKKIWHTMLLNFPIIGPIVKKVNLARFSRTLGALLKTDVPIIKALEVTADVLGNVHFKESAMHASQTLVKGVAISEVLKERSKLFPPLLTTMLAVGEKSGTTDTMLHEVAEFYEEDVDQVTKNLSTVIEPLLILFLGVVVGGIAVAVISPIYSLTQQF